MSLFCSPLSRRRGLVAFMLLLLLLVGLSALGGAAFLSPRAGASAGLAPVFSQPGGYYDRDIRLELSAPDPRAQVVFTLDGRVPTYTVGAVYTQPIYLSAAAAGVSVVRARLRWPGGGWGPLVSASYMMSLPATLPILSLIVAPDDMWSAERGIYANPKQTGVAWERPVDVTYVDKDRRAGFHVPAGLRIHGHWSRDFAKKSLRLYFRSEYGMARLDYPLFAGRDVRSFKRLVLHSGGEDWNVFDNTNWTLLRNALTARLAGQVVPVVGSQPALLFINGQAWGIYQLRERLDPYFLADHYGLQSADFLESPDYYTGGEVVMGSRAGWDRLLDFVQTHPLTDPVHYAYVQTQVDIPAFIDYVIFEVYTANIDWPEDNTRQFRPYVQGGRWRWILWDSDRGYGMFLHSMVSTNILKRVLDRPQAQAGERDVLLLRRLLENPDFRTRFVMRSADLLNTRLSPAAVIAAIDALAAELEPDIAYEALRWSSLTDWSDNIRQLREFVRQRPGYVRRHLDERFELGGTATLSLTAAVGQGQVAVNGQVVDLPWQGVYFRALPAEVQALPAAGYRFAGWESALGTMTASSSVLVHLSLTSTQTLTARFEPEAGGAARPGDVVFTACHVDDNGGIEGDWFELEVRRAGGLDLRGWRVTDNDSPSARDEGSLVFGGADAFAALPAGVRLRVIATRTDGNAARFERDDLDVWDGQMVVYVGNGPLDDQADPWFNLGEDDNLALLATGPEGERAIAFAGGSSTVTPLAFGLPPLVSGEPVLCAKGGGR